METCRKGCAVIASRIGIPSRWPQHWGTEMVGLGDQTCENFFSILTIASQEWRGFCSWPLTRALARIFGFTQSFVLLEACLAAVVFDKNA